MIILPTPFAPDDPGGSPFLALELELSATIGSLCFLIGFSVSVTGAWGSLLVGQQGGVNRRSTCRCLIGYRVVNYGRGNGSIGGQPRFRVGGLNFFGVVPLAFLCGAMGLVRGKYVIEGIFALPIARVWGLGGLLFFFNGGSVYRAMTFVFKVFTTFGRFIGVDLMGFLYHVGGHFFGLFRVFGV